MYELTARDISRTAITHRWHMVMTRRQQSLSDHLYLVTMFSLILIAKCFGTHRPPQVNRELIMEFALTHDLPEVITGDIPTPLKKRLRALGAGDALNKIEDDVDPRVAYLKDKAKVGVEGDIVKLADLIEAITFLNGCGRGNHAKMVETLLRRDLNMLVKQMEVDWPVELLGADWEGGVEAMLQDLTSGVDTMIRYEAESRKKVVVDESVPNINYGDSEGGEID